MKNVLLCCALISFVGCVKSVNEPMYPTMTMRESRNCILDIQNCPLFIQDYAGMYKALNSACDAAEFGKYYIHSESVDEDLCIIYAYAEGGYAALWIRNDDKSCTLEFCTNNFHHNYSTFLNTFLVEFHSIQRDEEWHKTFTDLLE